MFDCMQLQRNVKRLTDTFMYICGGDEKKAAKVLSNFLVQKAVQPFVYNSMPSAIEKFGENVRETVMKLKISAACQHVGSLADMMKRGIVVAGASGPLSTGQVRVCSWLACYLSSPVPYGHLLHCLHTTRFHQYLMATYFRYHSVT